MKNEYNFDFDYEVNEKQPNLNKLDLKVKTYSGLHKFDLQVFYDEKHKQWADGDPSFWEDQSMLTDSGWLIIAIGLLCIFFWDLIGTLVIIPLVLFSYSIKLRYRYMFGWVIFMVNHSWDYLGNKERINLIEDQEYLPMHVKRQEFYSNTTDRLNVKNNMSKLYK